MKWILCWYLFRLCFTVKLFIAEETVDADYGKGHKNQLHRHANHTKDGYSGNLYQHRHLNTVHHLKYFPKYERFGMERSSSSAGGLYSEDLSDFQTYLMQFYDKKAAFHLTSGDGNPGANKGENARTVRKYEKDDVLPVNRPLLQKNTTLSYSVLRKTPHGRHLLLITLFEGFGVDYWEPRCDDIVKFYLPDSLKKPDQPPAPEDACVLEDVKINGKVVTRADILDIYKKSSVSNIDKTSIYSRFVRPEVRSVNAMVKLCLEQENFDSLLSLLVVLRDACNTRVFKDALFMIIQARIDVGFVMPSHHSIHPEDFFPDFLGINDYHPGHNFHHEDHSGQSGHKAGHIGLSGHNSHHRFKRQSGQSSSFSFRTTHRTYSPQEPEYNLWHLREDCMTNTMHATWHILLSDANARFVMPRRGEMFYHMHHQMINRYNVDRLAYGMNLVEPYGESHWGSRGLIGYNSNLNANVSSGVRAYPVRRPDQIITETRRLRDAARRVKEVVDSMTLGNFSLRYENGVDYGISPLADAIEPYGGVTSLGNLHNSGHMAISRLSEGDDRGVMAVTDTSLRDPAFYRWHKYIDTFLESYKRNLGRYPDSDLDFRGVEVTSLSISSSGRRNQLRTFVETATLPLDRNLRRRRTGGTSLTYERVNHEDYVINVRFDSEVSGGGVARVFLVPSSFANREVYDVAVELDKFFVQLRPGPVNITRRASDSPLFSKGPPSLHELQTGLLNGMNEADFNWGHCGWPLELAIPKGNPRGMQYQLILIITPLLPGDRSHIDDWNRLSRTSWGWCGIKEGDGTMPDSRPMGFPFDRPSTTLRRLLSGRGNVASTRVTITHQEQPIP